MCTKVTPLPKSCWSHQLRFRVASLWHGSMDMKELPLVNGGMIHHIFYIKLLIIIPFPNIPPIPIHAHQKEKPHAQSPCSGLPSCMIFGIGVLSNLAAKNCANC